VTFEREAVFSLARGKTKISPFQRNIRRTVCAFLSVVVLSPKERERNCVTLWTFFFVRSVYTSAAGTQNRRCLFETFLLLNGDVNTNTDIILIIVFEGVVHVEKKTAKNNREKNEQRDDVGAHDERYGC
jgi:hypothetical protein